MKKLITLACMVFAFDFFAFGVPLDEEFDGNQINSARWQTWEPFRDSSVRQTNGVLQIQNGGHLLSVESFAEPFEVAGRFRFSGNIRDVFVFVIRTTGDTYAHWHELSSGLGIRFNRLNDPGNDANNVIIQRQEPNIPILADLTIPFEPNEWLDFKIQDFGTSVLFFFKEMTTPIFSVQNSTRTGGKIGFYNREGVGGGSSISSGSVVEVDSLKVRRLGLLGPNRYEVISGNFTWQAAKLDAEMRGGHLATITSESEWNFVKATFGNQLLWLWLGGSDQKAEGQWEWVTGEPWSFTDWSFGQPDDSSGAQDFLWLHPGYSLKWDDSGNIGALGYLLEKELADQDSDGDGLSDGYEIGQGRYEIINGSFTWLEAKADAEARGGIWQQSPVNPSGIPSSF